MRGLNRLAMVVVLAVGLLGVVVAAGPPLGAVPDGWRVTGGDCYVEGSKACDPPTAKCIETECSTKAGSGNNVFVTCPADAVEHEQTTGAYDHAVGGGPPGKITTKTTGSVNCIKVRQCSYAGVTTTYPSSTSCGKASNGKFYCAAGVVIGPPASETGTHDKTVPDGDACPALPNS